MKYTTEFKILNTYFWAEMVAGLTIGRWIRKVENFDLVDKLLKHTQDEFNHSQFWKKRILELGFTPVQIHSQKNEPNYFIYLHQINNIEEFLCAVHAYEKRIPWYLSIEKSMDFWTEGSDQIFNKMIEEEFGHINWIKKYLLQNYQKEEILKTFQKASQIENQIFKENMEAYINSNDGNLQKLGQAALKKNQDYSLEL